MSDGTVAVVDIGTNSTRLLIAELQGGRIVQELHRETNVTRLGAGVDAGGRLAEDAQQRVFDTLDAYRGRIERAGVDRAVAVLTSAVRDAANGREFADAVAERYHLEAHVLDGEQEARLTFLGATDERDPEDRTPTLVIDIGGGSTELVIGSGREVGFHVSTQAGVVRQSERHIAHDPPTDDELRAVAEDVRQIIAAAVPAAERDAVRHAIAVAGTPTSLAAIAQSLEPYDPARVHGYRISAEQRDEILGRLVKLTLKEREAVPGLHPQRAPTIIPGIVILTEVMALFGLDEVEVSEHDILRGAALGLAVSS
jgi:exopolyphosphatase/guanosine-5'-triphosphate,3'-diphosphate pyrophosphatase